MRSSRPAFLFGLLSLLVATIPSSCSTKAVGIDECRDIEYARCEAGVYCTTAFAIDDVKACKRYYRDQCLRGLDISQAPGKPEVTECVDAIKRLGACAKASGEDSLVTACDDVTSTRSKVRTVCELLKTPEAAPECSFLVDDSTDSSGGSGGESGASGGSDTGGDAGTAGTAGTAGSSSGGSGGAS